MLCVCVYTLDLSDKKTHFILYWRTLLDMYSFICGIRFSVCLDSTRFIGLVITEVILALNV